MSRPVVIANWKMNVPPEGIRPYMQALEAAGPGASLRVAPPFPYLREVASTTRAVAIGAQNCADQAAGAYTGEVSATMILEAGGSFAIVGHSERRTLYAETDSLVAGRLAAGLAGGLSIVLCIGENLEKREAGDVAPFLAEQVRQAGARLEESSAGEVIIAYEPIWAIGTGRNASGAMVAETVATVRDAVRRFWPASFSAPAVLYGGSVTPENVEDLVANGGIDGFLVGGASLDSGRFLAIRAAFGAP